MLNEMKCEVCKTNEATLHFQHNGKVYNRCHECADLGLNIRQQLYDEQIKSRMSQVHSTADEQFKKLDAVAKMGKQIVVKMVGGYNYTGKIIGYNESAIRLEVDNVPTILWNDQIDSIIVPTNTRERATLRAVAND